MGLVYRKKTGGPLPDSKPCGMSTLEWPFCSESMVQSEDFILFTLFNTHPYQSTEFIKSLQHRCRCADSVFKTLVSLVLGGGSSGAGLVLSMCRALVSDLAPAPQRT